jgi:hypothetical protein
MRQAYRSAAHASMNAVSRAARSSSRVDGVIWSVV